MMHGGVDWNDLRHFLAAYRARSLAGAARKLEVEHTTVSRRLAALETALEAKLFTRTPDGLAPTPVADELAPLAEEVERAVATFERRAAAHDARIEGVVRLATSEGFTGFLVKRLVELRARHPALTVEVLSGNPNLDLTRGEADLAVRLAPTTQKELVAKKLCEAGWTMYATEAYLARRGAPSPVTDLRGHEVVGFDDTMQNVPGARWLAEHGDGATVVLRGNSLLSVLNAAMVGMGLAVLPCLLAEPEPTLRRVSSEVLGARGLWLVVHPDLAKVARVRAVMDFIAEMVERDRKVLVGS
jgi:DNA-binding transcriptional LysR family regulator